MDTLCAPNWSHICSYIGHIFWYLEGESLGIGEEKHLGIAGLKRLQLFAWGEELLFKKCFLVR